MTVLSLLVSTATGVEELDAMEIDFVIGDSDLLDSTSFLFPA